MATKVLRNGAIYDTEKGRIVAMRPELATESTQITKANASALQARRVEIARERVIAGANAAVAASPTFSDIFDGDDLDFVEAGAQAIMTKALNSDDPKQVDAWRAVMQEAGLSQKQQPATPAEQVGDILRELAAVAREIAEATRRDDADIVDGTTTAHSDDGGGDGDGTRTTVGVG